MAGNVVELQELRARNAELERELREAREGEAAGRRELERARAQLRVVEEAEERLSAELGELEAEASAQARAHQFHICALSDRLAAALRSAGLEQSLD